MRRIAAMLVVAFALAGCKSCSKPPPVADAGVETLVLRRVPNSPLVVAIPKSWKIDVLEQPLLIEPSADGGANARPDGGLTAVEAAARAYPMQTRTLLRASPDAVRAGSLVAPMLMVLHDPWLPKGTTGVDYLVAQRAANQAVVGGGIRHVDAEPGRRAGRPSYHVRDEWTVEGPNNASADVAQEAILVLDADRDWLHGYAVVVTLEKRDFAAYAATIRAVLDSVGFKDTATPTTK